MTPADYELLNRWEADAEIKNLVGEDRLNGQWPRSNRRLDLAILLAGHQLIGRVSLEEISWRARTAELKIVIGPREFWGQGYGRESIQTLVGHFFSTGKLRRIYLRVYRDNRRAIRCYEQCGFEKEGYLQSESRDGFRELILMSLEQQETA
ncbi:MAG: GNAT family N-acetyltransferase [Firmicutes bacterium]|nr:GNAT family N-acetyltransferase [Bacillota bacterium]